MEEKKKEERFFNFPIQLLEGFMIYKKDVLNEICDYAIYDNYLKLESGNKNEKLKACEKYFGITLGNKDRTYKRGKILNDSIPEKSPKVGINVRLWFDYYKNDKTDFELITLLGFLSIKSILQNKSYIKITNKYWLSRMDGQSKSVNEYYELSEPIRKYAVHYQLRKIKAELERNWNLKTVSGKGFNVSFKMDIDSLTYEVLKKRKKYKDEIIKHKKEEAKRKALERLYGTQP